MMLLVMLLTRFPGEDSASKGSAMAPQSTHRPAATTTIALVLANLGDNHYAAVGSEECACIVSLGSRVEAQFVPRRPAWTGEPVSLVLSVIKTPDSAAPEDRRKHHRYELVVFRSLSMCTRG